ncbi:MAG: AI-2E family transporter [Mariprofundaceae bacterium]|nr:AI-2E family transporter [Mariprofundaceae bacterium]
MSRLLTRFLMQPAMMAGWVFGIALAAICGFVQIASPILFTLGLSIMFYAALSPTVDTLVRRDVDQSAAVAIVMVFVIVLMLGITALLYPALSHQFEQFSSRAGDLDERILALCMQLDGWVRSHMGTGFDPHQVAKTAVHQLSAKADGMSAAISSYFSEVAFSLVLVPLITFFLLRDFRMLRNVSMQALPNRYFELGWMVYNVATSQLQNYTRGIFIQALVMSMICTLGFWMAGVDYAPVLGLLVGLLNLIPFFGISLAKIPPVLVVLLSDQPDFISVLLALAVVFVAQTVDNVYLMPRVVAKSASLHPLTVMLGVMLAGFYYGFAGLVLAVPVIFSMKVIYCQLVTGIRQFGPKSPA